MPAARSDLSPYFTSSGVEIYHGDALAVLRELPEASVHCCVTSPPYWGLRDYGVDGQLGLEPTPEEFVEKIVGVFREVRRVLRDDGTVWLNIGDTYNAYNHNRGPSSGISAVADVARPFSGWEESEVAQAGAHGAANGDGDGHLRKHPRRGDCESDARRVPQLERGLTAPGLKPKDLCGIPWRVAFALQDDGWYLRQDIIWHKPNPMPESVTDRCTKSHEYIFLLSKSPRYYFDAGAIREPLSPASIERQGYGYKHMWGNRIEANGHSDNRKPEDAKTYLPEDMSDGRGANKRSVWSVVSEPYKGAHFATFPRKLIEPCILAGCPEGGVVLDPFSGSGTTGEVARKHGRRYVGIELNAEYIELSKQRFKQLTLI